MLMLKRCRYDKESIEVEKGGTEEQQFAQFYNQWFNYYVNLYSLVVGTVMVFFIYYFRKQRRREFISSLVDELLQIRSKLDANITTKDLFTIKWLSHKNLRKVIRNVKDFIMIDSLYKKVVLRNDNLNTDKIRGLNQECLFLVNKALDIEWEKYREWF